MGFARVAHQGYEERLRELRRAQAQGLGTIGKEPVALDISRALGDREFKAVSGKALLVPTPGVRVAKIDESHKFVALVCGGIPTVMTNADIVAELDLIREADPVVDVRASCGSLVQEAYNRGSVDNLTAILVRLDWPGGPDKAYVRKVASVEKAKQAALAAAAAAAAEQEGKASAAAASKRR